jgi:hypothetical protein
MVIPQTSEFDAIAMFRPMEANVIGQSRLGLAIASEYFPDKIGKLLSAQLKIVRSRPIDPGIPNMV